MPDKTGRRRFERPSRTHVRIALGYVVTFAATILIFGGLEISSHQVVSDLWFETAWVALAISLIGLALTFRHGADPEPRVSAQWDAHLEDIKQFSLRVASAAAIGNYRDLWDEEIRDSLSVHFPEKGQRLVVYQQAVNAYSLAERALLDYCITETPKIGVANVSGSITKALVHWGTEFADGHDPTQEAHAFLGGTDALRERRGRTDKEQEAFHQWLDSYLVELKASQPVVDLGVALRSRFTTAIAAGNVSNDLKPIHRVPGPRCYLCADYPA
jgi:hypothetical protein